VADDIPEKLEAGVEADMRAVKREARTNAPVARTSGPLLKNSIVYGNRGLYSVGVDKVRAKHTVEATAPYSAYVEYGTGVAEGENFPAPDNPPFASILEWMKSKPVQPRSEGIGALRRSAWKIATTIAEEGQQSHPFMRPAFNSHMGPLRFAPEEGIEQALRQNGLSTD
jgi:Bacteriophage protein of unknown function (DUF646).